MTDQLGNVNDADPMVGGIVGGVYRIERVISHQSSSVTYLGRHERTRQAVAIKVASETSSMPLMARFGAEARVHADLVHPNIVTVHDVLAEERTFAIVTEFIEGISLEHLLARSDGPLDPDRIYSIIRPVVAALSFAHSQGVVHRAMRPSNIMIRQVDGSEVPILTDFGISHVLAVLGSHSSEHEILQRAFYIAPEQTDASRMIDARTDIYSLGIVLYEMATGQLPFLWNRASELMVAHQQEQPLLPSDVCPEMPEALSELIDRCLAKSPADRFASGAELATALDEAAQKPKRADDTPLRRTPSGPASRVSPSSEVPVQITPSRPSAGPTSLLRLRVPERDDWHKFLDPHKANVLFCPTPEPPAVGTTARIQVTFVKGPRFYLHGVVAWRRSQHNDPRARAGVGVEIAAAEIDKLEFVSRWAVGGADDQRDLMRLPVRLRVAYTVGSRRRVNFTRNISEGGVFVRSQELLEVGTTIRLILLPPGDLGPQDLEGVVSWRIEDPSLRGMGISLRFRDDARRNHYVRFVERLAELLFAGELSDDVMS